MRVEVMDVIGGANAESSSPDGMVVQKDAALVARARIGDARAFELLVQRHKGKIFALALRMTRNREDAEDVVQQSFQQVFIHLNKFEGESLFSTWLTRISINEALMLLRKKAWVARGADHGIKRGRRSCTASGYSGLGPES